MVLPQAMAWVQYWFRVLSLKFCKKSKKNCRDISQVSPAFCMYGNPFYRPIGRVLPIDGMSFLFGKVMFWRSEIFWGNFSASYMASEFSWQIARPFLWHLRLCLREALKDFFFRNISLIMGVGSVFLNFLWNFGGHCFWPWNSHFYS